LIQIVVPWIAGASPAATLLPVQGFNAGAISYLLALIRFLDNKADAALKTVQPALKTSEVEYSQLRRELTTLPARTTLVASLAAVAIVVVIERIGYATPSRYEALAKLPVLAILFHIIDKIGAAIFGAFLYHTIHQLRVVNRIHTRHARINLFRMMPVYAFSRLTAPTAVGLTAGMYGWVAINPDLLSDPVSIGITLLITVLAAATFAWPLLGVHRLLVEEKCRLLDQSAQRFEVTSTELYRRIDGGEFEEMDELNTVFATLEAQRNVLDRIPTWPWRPETLRLLLTALAMPLGLWIIQFVLQFILGP
jgi:hypothetical protein